MTPLAHYIAKQQLLPVDQRQYRASSARFSEWHCFDCSPVIEMATILAKKMVEDMRSQRDTLSGALAFLPAPQTWIEWRHTPWSWAEEQRLCSKKQGRFDPRAREGFLLSDRGDGYAEVSSHWFDDGGKRELGAHYALPIACGASDEVKLHSWEHDRSDIPIGIPGYGVFYGEDDFDDIALAQKCIGGIWASTYHALILYACLAMINTPSVVGRRVNRAHAGLQKRLASLRGSPHGGALRPWTEIVLEVTEPRDGAGADACAAERMSGRKALHFCRSHLRIQNGRLTRVRAHWRGDAALGIVQSRYKVA